MGSSKVPGVRGLALALLTALVLGPAGVGGVLHPADDPACDVRSARGSGFHDRTLSSPGPDTAHCQACHLLRSVRWGISASTALLAAPQAHVVVSRIDPTQVADSSPLAHPGRSPPPMSPVCG